MIFAVAACALGLYIWSGLACPFKAVTGMPCPTCGMTRSLVALSHGDIGASLACHPFTIPLGIMLLFGIHKRHLPIKKAAGDWMLCVFAVGLFGFYVYRLFVGITP